jgi:hypothetical protein
MPNPADRRKIACLEGSTMARHALCIGINDYPGTGMDLFGCVNDALDWSGELQGRGFTVTTLLDAQATRAALLAAMTALVDGAQPGDIVVMTFSGHGTFVADSGSHAGLSGLSGAAPRADEADGYDEALCPHDVQETGQPITDDEIHALFLRRRPGARIVLIADSCHSGTVKRAAGGARPRFLKPSLWRRRGADGSDAPEAAELDRRPEPPPERPRLPALAAALTDDELDDVLMAGCMEGHRNFSYDAVIEDRANGAFTHHALRTLRALPPGATYADWHAAIGGALPSADFPQTPQLVATEQARQRPVFQ